MDVLGVIPARYGSSRFPGKALAKIHGRPLVQLVWERAKEAKRLDQLLVATDDQRILGAVKGFGGQAVMTPSDLPTGTDRVWAAAKETSARIIVNIQGDEPLLSPGMVDHLIQVLEDEPKAQMATLGFPMKELKGYTDPNIVKVVTDPAGWALYFSRAPIPYRRRPETGDRRQETGDGGQGTGDGAGVWTKHIGLYAYRRELLEQFVQWPRSLLEKTEGLEQLRALEHGVRIRLVDSPQDTIGVDTPEDLTRVKKVLRASV